MRNKAVYGIIHSLLLLGLLSLAFTIQSAETEPTTIVVPDDYPTIQEAINAASNGDTVYVRAGTYYENVVVNKSVSLTGENPINTIIDANGIYPNVIRVPASYVVICNFSITNSWIGISLIGSNNTVTGNNVSSNHIGISCGSSDWDNPPSNTTITGNNVTENESGIELFYSCTNFKISKNYIANNQYDGVFSWTESPYHGPTNITMNENNITGNGGSGISFGGSANNTIFGNVMSDNGEDGITLLGSDYNMISKNQVSDNSGDGIALIHGGYKSLNTEHNMISKNTVTGNLNGVSLRGSSWNNVSQNRIVDNQIGVCLDYHVPYDIFFSEQNTISENNVTGSVQFGIWVRNASNNLVYHNSFINNEYSTYSENSINIWDIGYPCGGNYWSDYVGVDVDGDGIGDTPYVIDGDNRDNYPLMRPVSPIPGDVNSDGIVDIFDVGYVSAHWYPGPPIGPLGYDVYADINCDGAVDIFDIGIVSAHWGESDP